MAQQPNTARHAELTDLACRIAGPQGSGIDTIASLFAQACAAGGLEVFGRREYHSNIMGRHSYYDVRLGPSLPACHRETLDALITFEPEAVCRHVGAIRTGGLLIQCADDADVALQRVTFLGRHLRDRLAAQLAARDLPATLGGLTQHARERGVQTFAIPFHELLQTLGDAVKRTRGEQLANTLALSAACALLGLAQARLREALEQAFAAHPDLAALNLEVAAAGYEFALGRFGAPLHEPSIPEGCVEAPRLLVNASQSTALGKLAGGLGLQTYYPISPATDESSFLEAQAALPSEGDETASPLVLQVEDELAAIGMACGAALTGARAATATSGPGFSLMTETLGWAGMNEVPVVVTLYQRGGPSTGMPTRTEQGDLQFAVYGGHGEYPRLVLASANIRECFRDAAQAFDYAERYQLPVIHLLDKHLASSTQTLPPFEASGLRIDRGAFEQSASGDAIPRFALTESGVSPRPALGHKGGQHWLTGTEHGEQGRVSEDPTNRAQMMAKRARKLEVAAREIPREEKLSVHGTIDAPLTILGWGSTHGALTEAIDELDREGICARLIQLRLLWPFPGAELEELLTEARPLIVAELNHSGQLATLLRAHTGRACDHLVVKCNGRPFSAEALTEAVRNIHAGQADARIELQNPWE